ncbi:polysaccharide pyruvyl transferase family protein [Prochlorococcus sp. MIT 1306]
MYGTFDVDNYGDLLMPIIAQKKITSDYRLLPISPEGQPTLFHDSLPSTPITVSGRPCLILIGGGNIITRSLKPLAEHMSWSDDIDLAALSIWVGPLIQSIRYNVPIVWNMPGCLDKTLFTGSFQKTISRWISQTSFSPVYLRDKTSVDIFRQFYDGPIEYMPDSSFSIRSIYKKADLYGHFDRFREKNKISTSNLLVVNIKPEYLDISIESLAKYLDSYCEQNNYHLVLLPLGLCHGDLLVLTKLSFFLKHKHTLVNTDFCLIESLSLIAYASLYIGCSYHGAISAACYKTPLILVAPRNLHKFDDLQIELGFKRYTSWLQFLESENSVPEDSYSIQKKSKMLEEKLEGHWTYINKLISSYSPFSKRIERLPERHPNQLPITRQYIFNSLTSKPEFNNNRNICPICKTKSFSPGGASHFRLKRLCNKCGSLPRHRAVFSALVNFGIPDSALDAGIMFSKDQSISPSWFKTFEYSIYNGDNHLDLCDIARPNESYDFIALNHVLEHTRDDKKALKELSRILRIQGYISITVPSPAIFPKTDDWGYPDPNAHNHYRNYGREFYQLLCTSLNGFTVLELQIFDPVTLTPDYLYLCHKSDSKLHLSNNFRLSLSIPYDSSNHNTKPVLEQRLWHLKHLIKTYRITRALRCLEELKISFPDELRVNLLEIDLLHILKKKEDLEKLLEFLVSKHPDNKFLQLRNIRFQINNKNPELALIIANSFFQEANKTYNEVKELTTLLESIEFVDL